MGYDMEYVFDTECAFTLDIAWEGTFVLPEDYFKEAEHAYEEYVNLKEQGKQHWFTQKWQKFPM